MSDNGNLKRKSAYTADPNHLTIVGHDTDDDEAREHPLWDPRASLEPTESMVKNIMHLGVIEPIIVVREGDALLVVDGRHRAKAARIADERIQAQGGDPLRVPILMRAGNDSRILGVMVSANEHRREDDPIARSEKAARMLDLGATEAEVANAFGVTEPTVKQWVSLLGTSTKVKHSVRQGAISATAAATLAKLPKGEQDAKLAKLTTNGRPTVKRTRKAVDDGKPRAPGRAVLRRLANDSELPSDMRTLLSWVTGDLQPTAIPKVVSDALARLRKAKTDDKPKQPKLIDG